MSEPMQHPGGRPKRSIFVPLVLVAVAVVGSIFSDVYQGLQQRRALTARISSLQGSVADATKVRGQFEALAKGVARLSAAGNRNAEAVMAQLNRAGVNVDLDR